MGFPFWFCVFVYHKETFQNRLAAKTWVRDLVSTDAQQAAT